MFLFTTPASTTKDALPASPVVDAIKQGADRTGTRFDYLLKTAQRESALDPQAKARTSSATGLFQFIEQTWLGMLHSEGGKHGLQNYAQAITPAPDGRYAVADPALKREILALRNDPRVAAAMAGELTQKNAEHLRGALGRAPTEGELYLAHVLGAQGAAELTRGSRATPLHAAASMFPEAAAANRSIFFDASGRARGVGEVYTLLTSQHGRTPSPVNHQQADASAQPLALTNDDGPALFGLFRTEGRRGPISDAVAKLWASNQAKGQRTASIDAVAYFPRETSAMSETWAMSETSPAGAILSAGAAYPIKNVPLPPERPSDINPVALTAPSRGQKSRLPLDLSRFMTWRPT